MAAISPKEIFAGTFIPDSPGACQISPAKPEAWNTVGRSKRLERWHASYYPLIRADRRPYYVTPAGFKPGSSALISMQSGKTPGFRLKSAAGMTTYDPGVFMEL
ncbi:MAG: hypothetical protein ACLP51_01250 [Syntrophobacteraceae bacterium]